MGGGVIRVKINANELNTVISFLICHIFQVNMIVILDNTIVILFGMMYFVL